MNFKNKVLLIGSRNGIVGTRVPLIDQLSVEISIACGSKQEGEGI
jgi:hypothetical protein